MSTKSKDGNNLTLHQQVLYELLKEFDSICRDHGIKYQLFAGTALGAVRHKGIIPWDDDLDIVMLREEYEKFLNIASKELDKEKYFLQEEYSEHWPMFFSKLRKNNTACLETVIPKDTEMHQGIYIDIFPCDNLSDNIVIRKIQFICSKIVISKSLYQRGYLTNSTLKKIIMLISLLFPKKLIAQWVQMRGNVETEYVHTFFGAASKYEKNVFPRIWFEESEDKLFGDEKYPVSCYYDQLLTKLYGEYMVPPSEDQKKIKVHAILVDVENSYEKYIEEQKTYRFDIYTRSIR